MLQDCSQALHLCDSIVPDVVEEPQATFRAVRN